jgi:hypothetical protein
MLHHAVDFAERHRFLGRASEAQIESFHAQFSAISPATQARDPAAPLLMLLFGPWSLFCTRDFSFAAASF